MSAPDTNWRPLIEYTVIAVLIPALVYRLIRHHWSVDWDGGEGVLAEFLGLAGFIAFGIRNWRY